jgi:hypothetical protein
MLTLIDDRWQRRGATRWYLSLGIMPSRGLWCSFGQGEAVQHQGARAVLLDLMGELRWLCFNFATVAARQRRGLCSFGGQNDCRGVYIGETPGVLCKVSSTEFIYNPFLESSIFIRIR